MSIPNVSIIAAIGSNRALGKDNRLLWNIPEDMEWFRSHTIGHPVIMGRKTFQSIGKPLPKRYNVVVSSSLKELDGVELVPDINSALSVAAEVDPDEIFIIGGEQVYRQTVHLADRLYLTVIDKEYKADSFFPDYGRFRNTVYKRQSTYHNLQYTFYILEVVS